MPTQTPKETATIEAQQETAMPATRAPGETAMVGPEQALAVAERARGALGASAMLALQNAAGNRAVVGLRQGKAGSSATAGAQAVGNAAPTAATHEERAQIEMEAMREVAPAVREGLRQEMFQFIDSGGESHRLFLDEQLRPMMHSDLVDLLNVLKDRAIIRQSPEQEKLLRTGCEVVLKIVNLTKLADALIIGKFAVKSDVESELYDLFEQEVLNKLKVLPSEMDLDKPDPRGVDAKQWFVKPAKIRVERAQVNGLVRGINEVLRELYRALATVLGGLNPPLQEHTRNTTRPPPGQPKDADERDRRLKKHFLPRTDFKYISKSGGGGSIKPLEVQAINISPNRSEGSEPENEDEVAGYKLLKAFGLTGTGPNWVRMHLINNKLGGRGIPENLTPGPHVKNQQMQRQFEKPLKKLVEREQDNTDVIWIHAKVTHHPPGPIPMSEAARQKATKDKLSTAADDFAQRIDLTAGISVFKDGAWTPDLSTEVQAPPVNVDLPRIFLPAETARGEKGRLEIKTPGEAAARSQDLRKRVSSATKTPEDHKERVSAAIELLALPEVYGEYIDRGDINKSVDASIKEIRDYLTTLDQEIKQLNYKLADSRRIPLEVKHAEWTKWIHQSLDRLGKGSESITMPDAARFSLGIPLPRHPELTQKEHDQELQIQSMQRELDSKKETIASLEAELAKLRKEVEIGKQNNAPAITPQSLTPPLVNSTLALNPPPRVGDARSLENSLSSSAKRTKLVDTNTGLPGRELLENALRDTKFFTAYGESRDYDEKMKPVAKRLKEAEGIELSQRLEYVRLMASAFFKADKKEATRERLSYLFTCAGADSTVAAALTQKIQTGS